MADIFDHALEGSTPLQALEVEFSEPNAGWISVRVKPLHELFAISCSYIWDPFRAMIAWLEEIADGKDSSTWRVNEEGRFGHLQFYGGGSSAVLEGDYLLHVQTDDRGLARVRGARVKRRQLVESFYSSFRAMTESPTYTPREWEHHPDYSKVEDIEDEEEYDRAKRSFPHTGRNLRTLTSDHIEAYLASSAEPSPE